MTSYQNRNWHLEKIGDENLKSYLSYILTYQKEQLQWYEDKKGKRRSFSTWLLNIALLTFSLSLILPLIPGLISSSLSTSGLSSFYASGYIALIITTIILLGDRLFGHSNGWIRYTLAYLQMDRVTSEFHNKWLVILPRLEGDGQPEETRVTAYELLEKFDIALKDIVNDETNNWKNLFTDQLAEFSKKADSRLETIGQEISKFKEVNDDRKINFNPVHLNLELKNIPDKSSIKAQLTIDSNRVLAKTLNQNGNTWAVKDIPVGIYLFEYSIIPDSGDIKLFQEFINITGESQIKNVQKSITELL
ncbi:SLATT domain-containing protein [Maribacter sp. 2307UL18-2]|uniref:SLATT domain-containing protein n=1 Tax=Maribacter sp. 2307UL18-2 TaxID=3386274 RepID=UPI0039BC3840